MKRVICLILSCFMVLMSNSTIFASTLEENTEIENIYKRAYKECQGKSVQKVTNDYEAYTYLLENKSEAVLGSTLALSESVFQRMSTEEAFVLEDFINRVNILVEIGAINMTEDLQILKADAPILEKNQQARVAIMEVLVECQNHAEELQTVYDNAIFGTAHIVAGAYFAERVKGGGIWDYKAFLGVNTAYYDPDLGATMTGETIGNFHYGYVGSVCFGASTLKSLAGIVQIYSGTSDSSYWNSYFDDPRDQSDIQWGINVYDASH